uniref:Sushi, von Willebrand factor type A, EGF and pentraxin domain-containing protein 1 n=1 Tax=Strongyloides stercoralis TaxID=6248 RepID=A0AAF5DN89_STRER
MDSIGMHCPDNWMLIGGKCYKIFNEKKSWWQGLFTCQRYGSYLAKIDNKNENDFIGSILSNNTNNNNNNKYWLGLTKDDSIEDDVTFTWSNGINANIYAGFWDIKQPNYHDGSCVFYNKKSNSWFLGPCNELLPFICQIDACPQNTFFCQTGQCISETYHCNGYDNCGDFSDELNCPTANDNIDCLKYFTDLSGTLQTPNFPLPYRGNSNCKYVIQVPENYRIQLVFEEFDTEENTDLVSIIDGGPAENTSFAIATLSGKKKNANDLFYTSSTNSLIIRFRSDSSAQGKGFKAKWTSININCGGELNAHTYIQKFNSPDYGKLSGYPNGLECVWIIKGIDGDLLSLTIENLDIEKDKDYLIIQDGDKPNSPILSKFTGKNEFKRLIISTQKNLYIYFSSDFKGNGKGFQIAYKRGCDNTISSTFGEIVSPGFLSVPYPTGKRCTYNIDMEPSAILPLTLSFNTFNIHKDDLLQIYTNNDINESGKIHSLNGFNNQNIPPSHIFIDSNKAYITFLMNSIQKGSGFNITFSQNCHSLKTPTSVTQTTKNTPFGYKVTVTCPIGYEFINGRGDQFDIECQMGGKWKETFVPDCQPKYCTGIPQILNGVAFEVTNNSYLGVIKYACKDGFYFDSKKEFEEITCTEEGKWGEVPKCVAKNCPPLPLFYNGERSLIRGFEFNEGSLYQYKCDEGYEKIGSEYLVCQSNGEWSYSQPYCKKLSCNNIPTIKDGTFDVTSLEFGEKALLRCNHGFISNNDNEIECTSNLTISGSPSCVDINECALEMDYCDKSTTYCHNIPGSYDCFCKDGFEIPKKCKNSNRILFNDIHGQINMNDNSICSDEDGIIRLTFLSLQLLDSFVIGSVERSELYIEVRVSGKISHKPKVYNFDNTTNILKLEKNSTKTIVNLKEAIQFKVFELYIHNHKTSDNCIYLELNGCDKTFCQDINECLINNGYCDHICINTIGGHECKCREGYDLFTFDGQNNLFVKEGETASNDLDVYRFNKTCVVKKCPPLSGPENGNVYVDKYDNSFGAIAFFQCNIGYYIVGKVKIGCQSDGTWNGTVPTCVPIQCEGLKNNSAIGLFITPGKDYIEYGEKVNILCTQQHRPLPKTPMASFRQCIYDPNNELQKDYWLSGVEPDCPLIECGPLPLLSGGYFDGIEESSYKVGTILTLSCRFGYKLIGKSSYDDNWVRCQADGTWDLGDMRCEGPICVDPGYPADGYTILESVEEGAIGKIGCNKKGYAPMPTDKIFCKTDVLCPLSEDVGISSGFIPDSAFTDSSHSSIPGYEPHKVRMSSTGWCGKEDSFIFLSIDLQKTYVITSFRISGVAGSGSLKGHITKFQLFYKNEPGENFEKYPIHFTTPKDGNHNKMYEFYLTPPIKGRYLLIGNDEFDTNPCMKIDVKGCLNLNDNSNIFVGWNTSVPECIDVTPPEFYNCPNEEIFTLSDNFGHSLPIYYEIPKAKDNSGYISWIKVEPEGFEPGKMIKQNMDVTYTAYDYSGNYNKCVVKLRIPDKQPPVVKCPESYLLSAHHDEISRMLYFNESSVRLIIQDISEIKSVTFNPTHYELQLMKHVQVKVTVEDIYNNINDCQFQIALLPEPCSVDSLYNSKNVIKKCLIDNKSGVTLCQIECENGYQFIDSQNIPKEFTCRNGVWLPSNEAPSCIKIPDTPAPYHLKVSMDYTIDGIMNDNLVENCLEEYSLHTNKLFDELNSILSSRCSSSVQIYVKILHANFYKNNERTITGNYTIEILPSVQKEVFYELCGLTLRTIFDIRIPGATIPVKKLLTISNDEINNDDRKKCPSINVGKTYTDQGFHCHHGSVLRKKFNEELPQCLLCSKGTYYSENSCLLCPHGYYQDEEGKVGCKQCPTETFTSSMGTISRSSCLAVCGYGMYSNSGMIPCKQCDRHTYTNTPGIGGFKRCYTCPQGTYTSRIGSNGVESCKKPCEPGYFSTSGLEPCSKCPKNYYQPLNGQQQCTECPDDTESSIDGSSNIDECKVISCDNMKCQNNGECVVRNHRTVCDCKPGFTGKYCEREMSLCDNNPCQNKGRCENYKGAFKCSCQLGFSGDRCQYAPDDCVGVECPNGGVCQDLPGIGNYKCICRSGFNGPNCEEISDICEAIEPCKNGAKCIPLQLGRYKCRCNDGWEGHNCEINTGMFI